MQNNLESLRSALGERVSVETADLKAHAGDLWPRRLLLARQGKSPLLPMAVVSPTSVEEVQALVRWAHQTQTPIVPFGGGSGVCGAAQVENASCVVVDLQQMKTIKEIQPESLYVTAEAGILGGELENALNQKGLTMGHFPTSYEISTLGGWISTRASGQFSTAYGSIEDMLIALKVVLPNGELFETTCAPRSATGPALRELFVGAEGTLGIVVEATCQAHKFPTVRDYAAYVFDDLKQALFRIRVLIQMGIRPAVVRLYDETDTQIAFGDMGLDIKGIALILVFQGEPALVEAHHSIAEKIFKEKSRDLGSGPAKQWWMHRFDLSATKMQQMLSNEGTILDTIEVAAPWHRLEALYQGMKTAMRFGELSNILVMAHFSHFYQTGGSIYFTFVGNVEEKDSINTYDLVWKQAMEACLKHRGTISHHHGIGLVKKAWLKKEWGEGHALFSSIKKVLDPHNLLNPNKLI